jgi:ribonuclease P/MRP protein subunit POP5
MKRMPPSLRERKRYIAFKLEGDEPFSRDQVVREIWNQTLGFLGENQASELNLWVLDFDEDRQEGFLTCSHKGVGKVKACLGLVGMVDNNKAQIQVLGVSGTIKALKRKFLNKKQLFKKEDRKGFFSEKEMKIIRSRGECLDALPSDDRLVERLKNLNMRYIGLMEKDIGGKKDATNA